VFYIQPIYATSPKPKILVVLSSQNQISVKKSLNDQSTVNHSTGFFLSELMVPLQKLLDAGFDIVVATPEGTPAVMDPISDSPYWFNNDIQIYKKHRATCQQLELCGSSFSGARKTLALKEVLSQGLDPYQAVFVPGGHAPMGDLMRNQTLGKILRYFHENKKITALICHGPVALLSALRNPARYADLLAELHSGAMNKNNQEKIKALEKRIFEESKGWIYSDYRVTAFSTKEEQQEEPGGSDNALGGYVTFYPDEALALAGAKSLVTAEKWQSHVVQDRELITAQNPNSDHEFAEAFLRALTEKSKEKNSL
jgi:putative intracellular protease/amidase